MPVPGQRPTSRLLRARRGTSDDLRALRDVLVHPEQVRLDHIERALPTLETIGGVLPEAVAHAAQRHPGELATAMAKPVTGALRDLARREPELFGEILAPSIGTAVRRAVGDVFAALLQRVNQVVERSLSLRSLGWRLEATRTGRSFAEVALAHTLVYRVEWVVLIHAETSLVLEQATLAEAPPPEADQISAMLHAISSFVSEAFQPASPGAELHTVEVGDLTLWVERDPAYVLAAATRGAAPRELRAILRETIDRVRTLHPPDAAGHVTDVTSFADTRPLLADCLRQQLRPTPRRARWVRRIVVIALAIALAWLVVRACTGGPARAERSAAYRAALASAPGIVVTSIEYGDGRYRIAGLRDPRAEPAAALVARAGLPPAELALAPFESRDPRLEPPLAAVDAAIRQLEAIEIPFELKQSTVDPRDPRIPRAAELVQRAGRAAAAARIGLCVDLLGHTDETGSLEINTALRSARAAAVARALHEAGVATSALHPYPADPVREAARRAVTFRAALRPDPRQGCPQ